MVTMQPILARLSDDGTEILCGREYEKGHRCPQVLARVVDWELPNLRRTPVFDQGWRPRADGVVYIPEAGKRRIARGGRAYRAGQWTNVLGIRRPAGLSFPFPIRAKCPDCGLVNLFDPVALDVEEVPENPLTGGYARG